MVNLTSIDTAIVKKINASKSKAMSGPQLETALPSFKAADIAKSLQFMLTNSVLTSGKNRAGVTVFKQKTDAPGAGGGNAPDPRLLSPEQKMIYGGIVQSRNQGINMRNLKLLMANKHGLHLVPVVMKKNIQALEKAGFVKSFTAVNAPTVPLFHGYTFEPDSKLIGGFFYNPNTKSLDTDLISRLWMVCLIMVRQATLPPTAAHYAKHSSSSSSAQVAEDAFHNYPLIPAMKRRPPSPYQLLAHVKKHNVIPNCTLDAVMQVMRAMEMEGLVERIKPIHGVQAVDGLDSEDDGADEAGPSKKRRTKKGSDDDSDDSSEEERKAKEKAKMKRRKEKAKEKEREKEKERKRKEKEREKREKKKAKEREKKEKRKRAKEKEKKKRKRDESDDSGDDSDQLRAVDESPDGKSRSKSKSKSKSSKRKRAASSDSDSDSDSDSTSASSSSSSSDSDSDSDSDASSVNSDDIDNDAIAAFRPSAGDGMGGEGDEGPIGIKDLRDTLVAWRAVRPYSFGFGIGEMPCGKCPVFSFCQEGGPVNATECSYIEGWLEGTKGGWTNEAELREQKEMRERAERANREAREAEKAKRAERERERAAAGEMAVGEGEEGFGEDGADDLGLNGEYDQGLGNGLGDEHDEGMEEGWE